jgi:hypothetical protein
MTAPASPASRSAPVAAEAVPVCYAADGRRRRTLSLRGWSVRHARFLEKAYQSFEKILIALDPLFRRVGYARVERPVAAIERGVKGLLFDCRMCGQCILSSTGMSCPMTCPKQLRNGPCGGVRTNGHCEVISDMPCVWVKAWEGSRAMTNGEAILTIQLPVNQALRETSSWLRVAREKSAGMRSGA